MRRLAGVAVAAALAVGSQAGAAPFGAPTVDIRGAVAKIVISPEPRSDVAVEVVRADPRLPLRIWRFVGQTNVDGGLGRRLRACGLRNGQPYAIVAGIGEVSGDAIPKLVIHTPMDARIYASGAVWGQIGRTDSLDFANGGCGDWQIANVRGQLRVRQAGSGETHAGQAGSADLSTAGAGSIFTREVAGPVRAMNVGSGDIDVASLNGAFDARIAGSGRVRAQAGHASAMQASIAGSGDIALGGVADSLKASVVGSGDVRVARVTGPVSKAVIGSGAVRIGS
jgi:Putative auto-transporter adhesin, head GIN domain